MTSRGLYAYCVVRSARRPPAAQAPPGLPGAAAPSPVAFAESFWLIAASVPLDRYGPAAIERGLRELEWAGEVALAHEAVVRHFTRMRGAAVIPMKLFTMFSSDARAVEELRGRLPALEEIASRVAGCEEWGVRIIRTAGRRGRPAAARSGSAFLAARKQARESAREAARAASDASELAFSSLSALARHARRRSDTDDDAAAPLLDAAFLVPSRRSERFRQAAKRVSATVARKGARMTITGPWPPYSFVAAPDAP